MKRLGILVPIIGFGRKGFYNSQEIGLGKAFAEKGYDVSIVKCLAKENNEKDETNNIMENLKITYCYCEHLGAHAKFDTINLNKDWDYLIVFADNQMCIPKVKKWCNKYNVKFLPYAGIIHSFGHNRIKQVFMDWIFDHGTCNIYRKNPIMVKNTYVEERLHEKGVNKTILAPVGLDYSVLHDCNNISVQKIRDKLGLKQEDNVIIFVGILTVEKRPLDALKIIEKLHKIDENYKLILVGKGYLKNEVLEYISRNHMQSYVIYIEEIANSEIWQLYYAADIYINLWEQEIFGMAILEALYYENFVVAVNAPGPNTILQYMKGSSIVNSVEDVFEQICKLESKKKSLLLENKEMLNQKFNWKNVATKFESVLEKL